MACVWLTGLSGAGKTTIAKELVKKLEDLGYSVDYLDGDIVRQTFTKDLGFSKLDRDENIKRVSYVASYLSAKPDNVVICAFISPYKEAREKARNLIQDFMEVYVRCPLDVCERRDVKGLYKKARAGIIKGFTGIDDPYEEPENPDMDLDTSKLTLDQCVDAITYRIRHGGGYC